jgi:hypothetical protein
MAGSNQESQGQSGTGEHGVVGLVDTVRRALVKDELAASNQESQI